MKNIHLYLSLLLFLFPQIHDAQDIQKVDSLLAIYNNEQAADSSKVKVLKILFNTYLYHDQEKAAHYLNIGYELAKKMDDELEMANCLGSKGILFDIAGQLDSSRVYYQKAMDFYEKANNRIKQEIVRFNLGMIEQAEGNYETAIDLMKENIVPETLVTKENALSQALSHGLLSRVYRIKGYHQLSLTSALTALKLIKTTEDESRVADALKDLANIEAMLLNHEKAIEHLQEAIPIYEKYNVKFYLAGAKTDIASNYIILKDYPNAIKYLNESLALAQEVGSHDAEIAARINLGTIYTEQGDFEMALQHLQNSLKICKDNDYTTTLTEVYYYIGNVYSKSGQYSKALSFYNQSIALADSIQRNDVLNNAYPARAETFESMRDYKAALRDYKKFQTISDSIFDTKKIAAIEELRIMHDLEQKEKDLLLFSKNAELDQVKKTRLWIALLATIGMGTLLLWAQWHRRKKEKELEAEKRKVSELEKQRLTTELDFKKQELTSKVLQLCRKNEFLQSLNKEVKAFKSESEGNEKHRLEKLSRKINRDLDADTDWGQFLKSFESVHPDFNKLLLQKYPNLAPNEIRMACLMRMNLESKDIANLFNITPDSVKKARYRMRKKMDKASTINLTEYFMNFGNSEN